MADTPLSHAEDETRAPRFVYPLIVAVEIIVIVGLYAFGVHFS